MERIPSSAIDQIAAYQLVLGCLPERDQWLQALRLRKDGSSPELVLKVLAAVRMELYIRMGDLVAGIKSCLISSLIATGCKPLSSAGATAVSRMGSSPPSTLGEWNFGHVWEIP
jgi:hypothetical protein